MNIVTPIPTSFAIPTANLSVEAARRDNLARESIPQPSDAKQGSAEQGLGSESDKLKSSVKGNQPLTYERADTVVMPHAAHAPFISHPQQTADILLNFISNLTRIDRYYS